MTSFQAAPISVFPQPVRESREDLPLHSEAELKSAMMHKHDINEATCLPQEADTFTPEDYVQALSRVSVRAALLVAQFERAGKLADINEAILRQQEAVNFTPDGHAQKPYRLMDLGISLRRRTRCLGELAAIDKAVGEQRQVVNLMPEGRTRQPAGIDKAIDIQRQMAHFKSEGHTHKPSSLKDLRIASSYARFIRIEGLDDIDKAISVQKQALDLIPEGHPSKPFMLKDLGCSLRDRFICLGVLLDADEDIGIAEQVAHLRPDGHANGLPELEYIVFMFTAGLECVRELDAIDEAISVQKKAVDLMPDGHSYKPFMLINLGISFHARFIRSRERGDVNIAIHTQQQAVDLTPEGHVHRLSRLNDLSFLLQRRLEDLGGPSDIAEIISVQKQAAKNMSDGHADKPLTLSNLGMLFHAQFKHLGDLGDIGSAISAQRHAAHLTAESHAYKLIRLDDLGSSLRARFTRLGKLADVDEAISIQQQAVTLAPDGHRYKPLLLNNLGSTLRARFVRTGELADIDQAISVQQQAVNLTPEDHVDKPFMLNNLGSSLLLRFIRLGDLADINKAVNIQRQAVKLTPRGHVDRPSRLNNLGTSLRARHIHIGELAVIDRAIIFRQQAFNDEPFRLGYSSVFPRHGTHLEELADIDEAIDVQNEAVVLTPEGHADKPAWLSSLGLSLYARFQRRGELGDAAQAISIQQRAVNPMTTNHTNRQDWSSFVPSAKALYREELANIDEAIKVQREALKLTPRDHADKPFRLNNLGISLRARFIRTGKLSDVDNSIIFRQHAEHITPKAHNNKSHRPKSGRDPLESRFVDMERPTDIDEAITVQTKAVELTLEGHSNKPYVMLNLAKSLLARHEYDCPSLDRRFFLTPYQGLDYSISLRNKRKSVTDVTHAISYLSNAANPGPGPAIVRYQAACCCATLLHPELAQHRIVIELIPHLVWLGRTVQRRYKDLETLGDAVMEAASAAFLEGDYDLALEWLEQGRSIVWGQILRLRSPVDALQSSHPELAGELNTISAKLEKAGTNDHMVGTIISDSSLEESAQAHRRMAEKWEALLTQIRKLPHFADFLQPKQASLLRTVSRRSVIVIINVSRHRSDALVLQGSSIGHVQLVDVTLDKLKTGRNSFFESLYSSNVRVRGADRKSTPAWTKTSSALTRILATLWKDIAKPILNYLGYMTPPTVTLPHITWCLTGPLAALPLHAAGIYDGPYSGVHSKLFNYVVSSYTPSLTALLETSNRTLSNAPGILAITQVSTPGMQSLPGTMKEVDQVGVQMSKYNHRFTRMDGDQATVASVSEAMNNHNWVHFSCHAKQDAEEPTKSAFHLHDSNLELAEIMKKPLQHAELAYLSACQTASGDAKLPDEAVHLAAGMFIAGYRSVVATLWSIGDDEAPLVAREFYDRLLRNPEEGVARALHGAVGELRKKVGDKDFISWVPYIHMGH